MSFFLTTFALFSAVQVITTANPVHSIFYLVLVFALTSRRRMTLSMEFRSLVFIMVYVGAIAVLFLFVVMRLNVQPDLKERPLGNIPMLSIVGLVFLFSRLYSSNYILNISTNYLLPTTLIDSITKSSLNTLTIEFNQLSENILLNVNVRNLLDSINNRNTLGQVLYTKYCVEFLLAGIVLLVSRIGAILLTLSVEGADNSKDFVINQREEKLTKNSTLIKPLRQQVHQQHSRNANNAIFKIT